MVGVEAFVAQFGFELWQGVGVETFVSQFGFESRRCGRGGNVPRILNCYLI